MTPHYPLNEQVSLVPFAYFYLQLYTLKKIIFARPLLRYPFSSVRYYPDYILPLHNFLLFHFVLTLLIFICGFVAPFLIYVDKGYKNQEMPKQALLARRASM
jgi:hypothetical protein